VLSTDALAAVDYPQHGGLAWERLEHLTRVILARPGCRGASVVCYNPELDAGAAAPRIAAYCRSIAHLLERK
jgi:arginase